MLGEKIKQYRMEKGLSQQELAEALSVVRQTVSKWEKGISIPDSQMLIKLSEVLDTTCTELLDAEEEQPLAENPLRRFKTWEIVLIALGSPIWLSLLISALAVVIALYATVWSLMISLWATFGALVGCGFCGALAGIALFVVGRFPLGLIVLAGGLAGAGLAIVTFLGCKKLTLYILILTKMFVRWAKKSLVQKGEQK